ncbi:MAG: flippase-like domain-containing protein [Deltaproteobacteria bacterium]|nr:flippase-like domain-containing protein [Deltaproteobacteria bacterium]
MKKKLIFGLKLFVSVGLLAYLFSRIEIGLFLSQYAGLKFYLLAVILVIIFFQFNLSTLKWRIILAADDIEVPYTYLLKNYLIGGFISQFLPTSFGGDIYRVYSLKEFNGNLGRNTSSVLFDRISGLFALVSISIISSIFYFHGLNNYLFITVYLVFCLMFWFLAADRTAEFLSNLKVKIPGIFIDIVRSFSKYKKNRKAFFQALFISVFFQHNIVWAIKLYCVALNIDISVKYLFMFVPLIYLTEAIPISINGIGIRDSAFVFFFLQVGNTKEEALALSLLVIMMRYMFSILVGGSLFLKMILNVSYEKKAKKVGN